MDDFTNNQTYFKNQFFPQNINAKPNNSNNLGKYINFEEDLVRKICIFPKSLLRKDNFKITLDPRREENSLNKESIS